MSQNSNLSCSATTFWKWVTCCCQAAQSSVTAPTQKVPAAVFTGRRRRKLVFNCIFSGAYRALVGGEFPPIRGRAVVPAAPCWGGEERARGRSPVGAGLRTPPLLPPPAGRPARGHLMPDTCVLVWLQCVDEYMKEKKK